MSELEYEYQALLRERELMERSSSLWLRLAYPHLIWCFFSKLHEAHLTC